LKGTLVEFICQILICFSGLYIFYGKVAKSIEGSFSHTWHIPNLANVFLDDHHLGYIKIGNKKVYIRIVVGLGFREMLSHNFTAIHVIRIWMGGFHRNTP
jgi:hypothetical protein